MTSTDTLTGRQGPRHPSIRRARGWGQGTAVVGPRYRDGPCRHRSLHSCGVWPHLPTRTTSCDGQELVHPPQIIPKRPPPAHDSGS